MQYALMASQLAAIAMLQKIQIRFEIDIDHAGKPNPFQYKYLVLRFGSSRDVVEMVFNYRIVGTRAIAVICMYEKSKLSILFEDDICWSEMVFGAALYLLALINQVKCNRVKLQSLRVPRGKFLFIWF